MWPHNDNIVCFHARVSFTGTHNFQTFYFIFLGPSLILPSTLHSLLPVFLLEQHSQLQGFFFPLHTADGHSVTPLRAHTHTHTHTHTQARHCSLCRWQWFRVLFTQFALLGEHKCLLSSETQLAEDLSSHSGTDLMLCVFDFTACHQQWMEERHFWCQSVSSSTALLDRLEHLLISPNELARHSVETLPDIESWYLDEPLTFQATTSVCGTSRDVILNLATVLEPESFLWKLLIKTKAGPPGYEITRIFHIAQPIARAHKGLPPTEPANYWFNASLTWIEKKMIK